MTAFTVDANGRSYHYHAVTLAECDDDACSLPRASRDDLFDGMEFDRSRGFDEGVAAAKGEWP